MPLVEIVHFSASEALIARPTLGDSFVDYLKKVDGCLGVSRGFQLEDKSRVFLFITWKTNEHYEKMRQRAEYPSFMASLKPLGSDIFIQHIDFDVDIANAFSAPITEITTIKAKEGHTQEEVNAVVSEIRANQHLVKGGHPPIAWGQVKQTPELYILIIGWDSVEAHFASHKEPPIETITMKLIGVCEPETKHVALRSG
ncbi:hypothetical protein BDZ97DRAFT_1763276 [Flammula alnicola]|nr:hypothetical protein BDZ97DRAFT_1763276 [Flammula alnicola]